VQCQFEEERCVGMSVVTQHSMVAALLCRVGAQRVLPTLWVITCAGDMREKIVMRAHLGGEVLLPVIPEPWSDCQSLSPFRTCICIQDVGQEITPHNTWLRPKEMFATQTSRTMKKYGTPSIPRNLSSDSLFVR
jgi:hypothetical protein